MFVKTSPHSQFKIMEMLLEHILEEKIEFATSGNMKKRVVNNEPSKDQVTNDNLSVVEERINFDSKPKESKNTKTTKIRGKIKEEREKALFIELETGGDIWFPKSTIAEIDESRTTFDIADWVLKKNKIIT